MQNSIKQNKKYKEKQFWETAKPLESLRFRRFRVFCIIFGTSLTFLFILYFIINRLNNQVPIYDFTVFGQYFVIMTQKSPKNKEFY